MAVAIPLIMFPLVTLDHRVPYLCTAGFSVAAIALLWFAGIDPGPELHDVVSQTPRGKFEAVSERQPERSPLL